MKIDEQLDAIARLRLLIIGEAMLDIYVEGHAGRLCREAPVPIIALDRETHIPGGAANTATSAAALGAAARLVALIGDDPAGTTLTGALSDAGVRTDAVLRVPGRHTIVKKRVTGNGQLLLRLDSGTEDDPDPVTERRVIEAITAAWGECDAVVVSDYAYGVCTPAVIEAVGALQARDPRVLTVDAKHPARWATVAPTACKPNYAEAVALLGLPAIEGTGPRLDQIASQRDRLFALTGAAIVTVTLDTAGALVFEQGHEDYRTFTQPANAQNATGAGDTFTAALTLALAAGAHSAAAADIASAAATACVATPGTSVCTTAMLAGHISGANKLASFAEAMSRIGEWQRAGKRVVFTNGCFDILHHGHITYLNRAKAMGDVLVLGLNSDASVRRLKGPTRPINAQDDRAAVLAALSCVDLVIVFDEPTPSRLIEAIRPDLFVKGGDYTLDTLPEAPLVMALGGEVKLLPFLDERSTTSIIERIRRAEAYEAAG